MYYKLFPNRTKIRTLEDLGFQFKMGSGQKILKQHLSRSSRARGVHSHRTLQNIVILYNGRFFRKFTKAQWMMLLDPSDKDSQTYGDKFLDELINRFGEANKKRQEELGIKDL